MLKKINKIVRVALLALLSLSILQSNLISIAAQEDVKAPITYNIPSKYIPFIYCYTYNNGRVQLENTDTELPEGTYWVLAYVRNSYVNVQREQTSVQINGNHTQVSWKYSDSNYSVLSFNVDSSIRTGIHIELAYQMKFSIKARKILSNNAYGSIAEMEESLNKVPATYSLYNEDKSIQLYGTSSTAMDSRSNFVHWTAGNNQSNYIGKDDTHVSDLPEGTYTLMETSSGGNLQTKEQSNSSAWLNSSLMKTNNGKRYYTFTVNKNTISEWMEACANGESNSLFYGFYTEYQKPITKVSHNVYLKDNTIEGKLTEVESIQVDHVNLVYGENDLSKFAESYVNNGYKVLDYEIEVKYENQTDWIAYDASQPFVNGDIVRYIIEIDKDENQTKTLHYTVEHWMEGEDSPRDRYIVEESIWVHDERTTLTRKDISTQTYEGYTFSHYEPIDLPKIVEDGMVIKAIYRPVEEIVVPIIPVVPSFPILPNLPLLPITTVVPFLTTPSPLQPVVNQTPGVQEITPKEETTTKETEKVKGNETPLANVKQNTWALINLISIIVTALLAILAFFLKHEKEEQGDTKTYDEQQNLLYRRNRWVKYSTIVVSVISIIIFLQTENMLFKMVLVDQWTFLMVAIAIIQLLIYFGARHWKEVDQKNKITNTHNA